MTQSQKKLLIVFGVIAFVILSSFLYVKGSYNALVSLDEGVKAAWAQVENQLKRRYDLIPNYIETVKGYAKHEKEVFLKVTEARSKVGGATTIKDKIEANNQMTSALSRLLLVVERYPDLKANANFIRLQDELAGTENRIAVERRRFNEIVKIYNIKVRRFPTNVMAGMFGFEKATFFQTPEAEKEVPKVKF